jgi:hypothetical protein
MRARLGVVAVALVALLAAVMPATPAAAGPPPSGYWLVAGDGGVFGFGMPFFGSAASDPTKCPPNTVDRNHATGQCFAIASTPTARGYWILNGDKGTIYRFGDAGSYGDPATLRAGTSRELLPTGKAIVSTPSGHGYWVLEAGLSGAGTVDHFGDAKFFGDSLHLAMTTHQGFNGMAVALAATNDGQGYWEVHSDGGVFGFGDAHFYGSVPGLPQPADAPAPAIVGIAPTISGKGYWLVSSTGQVFPFGDAAHFSDVSNIRLAAPIVGVARNTSGKGIWLVAADGGVFGLGGAPFLGSMGGKHLHQPVFGIAARRFLIA